jgi:hypothetical protein
MNDSEVFEWREIPCDSESAAKAEAEQQQQLEDPNEVEWIYLRNRNHEWVARRTPRNLTVSDDDIQGGRVDKLLARLLDLVWPF